MDEVYTKHAPGYGCQRRARPYRLKIKWRLLRPLMNSRAEQIDGPAGPRNGLAEGGWTEELIGLNEPCHRIRRFALIG